jgi:hypothetical protein
LSFQPIGTDHDLCLGLKSYGLDCYFGRSSDEKIYGWCYKRSGESQNKTQNKYDNKPTLIKILSDLNIIDMKCGFGHALGLTQNGEVYGWCETGDENRLLSTPIKKLDGFNDEKIVMISCGAFIQWHSQKVVMYSAGGGIILDYWVMGIKI